MITFLLFGSLADEAGAEKLTLAWQNHWQTLADVLADLSREHPQIGAVLAARSRVLYAINQTLVKTTAPVRDGDEVAAMPPVTGG